MSGWKALGSLSLFLIAGPRPARAGAWIDHPCEARLVVGSGVTLSTATARVSSVSLHRCAGGVTVVTLSTQAPTDLLAGIPFEAPTGCYTKAVLTLGSDLTLAGSIGGQPISAQLDVASFEVGAAFDVATGGGDGSFRVVVPAASALAPITGAAPWTITPTDPEHDDLVDALTTALVVQ